jgi:hypothetical protein
MINVATFISKRQGVPLSRSDRQIEMNGTGFGVGGSIGSVVGVGGSIGSVVGVGGSIGSVVGVGGSIGSVVGVGGSIGSVVGVGGSENTSIGYHTRVPQSTPLPLDVVSIQSTPCARPRLMRYVPGARLVGARTRNEKLAVPFGLTELLIASTRVP